MGFGLGKHTSKKVQNLANKNNWFGVIVLKSFVFTFNIFDVIILIWERERDIERDREEEKWWYSFTLKIDKMKYETDII